jgi:sulfite exporter TauE/SafE
MVAVSDAQRTSRGIGLHAAYHCGRLITYCTLGIVAGAIGSAVDIGGQYIGLQYAAAMIAGGAMILFGALTLARIHGLRVPRAPIPPGLRTLSSGAHAFAMRREPRIRALLIGMCTTLLPCGWLYAFVVTAAGTGHPLLGLLTMAVFWSGTLPAMVTLGAGAKRLTGAVGAYLPTATTCVVMLVGLWMVVSRIGMSAEDHQHHTHGASHVDDQQDEGTMDHSAHRAPAEGG